MACTRSLKRQHGITNLSYIISYIALSLSVLAAPASLVRRGAGKAGISWPQQERSVEPIKKFFENGTQLTWWWNWNKNYGIDLFTYDAQPVSIQADFVPMQYDTAMLFNQDPLQEGWKEIMGYNEPDLFTESGVSVPLSVNVAGDNWKTMLATLRQYNPQATFWSPSVAWNKDWLKGLFEYICPNGLKDCEWAPNYLTIHVYDTDVEGFKKQVTAYHDQFGLDIVISEYACFLWDGTSPQPDVKDVSHFMSETTAWLDSTPWIHKYAWFGTVRDRRWLWGVAASNRLMDASGAITDLGKQYIGGGQASLFGVESAGVINGVKGIGQVVSGLFG